jgi:secreted trypsin-like serine protease
MKRLIALGFALAMVVAMAVPAGAITRGGELDGEDHPYVGVMVAFIDGVPQWRCSGTMISPTVYVTAGHCTSGATSAAVWFESDVDASRATNGYPFGGGTGISGSVHTHPLYVDAAFYLYDLGVVVLDEPVDLPDYASLPDAGDVDDLGKGRKNAVVTAVGYGLQAASANPVKPDKTQADVVRYQADLFVVNTNGVAGIGNIPVDPPTNSMILSGDAKHGGTCFGDSGGPFLVGDTILGVNSFGLNGNCAGIGGGFRIDRDIELGWISSFLGGSSET